LPATALKTANSKTGGLKVLLWDWIKIDSFEVLNLVHITKDNDALNLSAAPQGGISARLQQATGNILPCGSASQRL
jgi:hypothetical protein